MNENIRLTLIDIFDKLIDGVEDYDSLALGELSESMNGKGAILQDKDYLNAAILVYALSKLLARFAENGRGLSRDFFIGLRTAKKALEINNFKQYVKSFDKLINLISFQDKKLELFIDKILLKAHIKRGHGLYSRGISMRKAAELLGISSWELASYIGHTQTGLDTPELKVLQRMKKLRLLFK